MAEPHPPTPAPSRPRPGPSAYHESSQFKHWRYSRAGLDKLRTELNEKSKEVTARNVAAEKVSRELRARCAGVLVGRCGVWAAGGGDGLYHTAAVAALAFACDIARRARCGRV
jgi:hypothetical protein